MIAKLTGKVVSASHGPLILDVGGVGFSLHVTAATKERLPSEGETTTLLTYLAVREDALELYGFLEERERALFMLLINLPKIGPKSALTILSAAGVSTIEKAVESGEASYLSKISGIGEKNADKIVHGLKGKISVGGEGEMRTPVEGEEETLDALVSLGYSTRQAREALKRVPKEKLSVGERLKEALKELSR